MEDPEDYIHSPVLPEYEGIPEDDEAEPEDAESDHEGRVEPEEDD